MLSYFLRRVAALGPTLLSLSIVVFLIVEMVPGDPARAILGERASEEALRVERERLGLNLPLHLRYAKFVGDLVRGDLGRSSWTGRPITEELGSYFPATLELTFAAMVFAVGIGLFAGVVAAANRNTILDYGVMFAALTGVSMPIFWLGLMLALLFQWASPTWPTSSRLDALLSIHPVTGLFTVDALLARDLTAFVDVLRHLVLPAIALGTIPLAIITRMTRSSLLEVLGQDYIRTARAKGLSELLVKWRHALKNAFIPILTVIGLQFGSLLGGAIITETIFAWPGVGKWILDAVSFRDFRAIQGGTLLIATSFITVNLVVDLLYAAIDPRIRYR
ncbi:MAG: ABC transporter permease [Acidobacteriota bacterium]